MGSKCYLPDVSGQYPWRCKVDDYMNRHENSIFAAQSAQLTQDIIEAVEGKLVRVDIEEGQYDVRGFRHCHLRMFFTTDNPYLMNIVEYLNDEHPAFGEVDVWQVRTERMMTQEFAEKLIEEARCDYARNMADAETQSFTNGDGDIYVSLWKESYDYHYKNYGQAPTD